VLPDISRMVIGGATRSSCHDFPSRRARRTPPPLFHDPVVPWRL
jgi:hypothetical protein